MPAAYSVLPHLRAGPGPAVTVHPMQVSSMPLPSAPRRVLDTAGIRPEQRVRYWEEQCRENLVSLRCSPHADEGLRASQVCVDAGRLRIARTQANAHVVERTPEMIRAHPRESIFVNLVVSGSTFAYQRGHCAKMQGGEMLVYDARYPYLVGGAPEFDLIHVDIPIDMFVQRLGRSELRKPVQVSGADGAHRLYLRQLTTLLQGTLAGGAVDDSLDHQVCDLLRALMGLGRGDGGLSALCATHLMAAKDWLEQHLSDEGLRATDVALVLGISERHLRRLFAAQDSSFADYLLTRRLDSARQSLQDPVQRSATVAETAYRFGFSSHAHFSRAFKQRYGLSPSDLLRGTRH
ncbi:MAG: hypothetical protein RJA98_194 [Pseudomonadota bacterium]|jgi:AraC-like DNA-binding protein